MPTKPKPLVTIPVKKMPDKKVDKSPKTINPIVVKRSNMVKTLRGIRK